MRAGAPIILIFALAASTPASAERRKGGPRLVKATPTTVDPSRLTLINQKGRTVDFTRMTRAQRRKTARLLERSAARVQDHPGHGPRLQNPFRVERGQTLTVILPRPRGSVGYRAADRQVEIVSQRPLPSGRVAVQVRPLGRGNQQFVTLSASGTRSYRLLVTLSGREGPGGDLSMN